MSTENSILQPVIWPFPDSLVKMFIFRPGQYVGPVCMLMGWCRDSADTVQPGRYNIGFLWLYQVPVTSTWQYKPPNSINISGMPW